MNIFLKSWISTEINFKELFVRSNLCAKFKWFWWDDADKEKVRSGKDGLQRLQKGRMIFLVFKNFKFIWLQNCLKNNLKSNLKNINQ